MHQFIYFISKKLPMWIITEWFNSLPNHGTKIILGETSYILFNGLNVLSTPSSVLRRLVSILILMKPDVSSIDYVFEDIRYFWMRVPGSAKN